MEHRYGNKSELKYLGITITVSWSFLKVSLTLSLPLMRFSVIYDNLSQGFSTLALEVHFPTDLYIKIYIVKVWSH